MGKNISIQGARSKKKTKPSLHRGCNGSGVILPTPPEELVAQKPAFSPFPWIRCHNDDYFPSCMLQHNSRLNIECIVMQIVMQIICHATVIFHRIILSLSFILIIAKTGGCFFKKIKIKLGFSGTLSLNPFFEVVFSFLLIIAVASWKYVKP